MRLALSFRLLALILLLSQALPAKAFARVLYACQFSGRVASTCCCKGRQSETEHAKSADASGAKLERPGCCRVQVNDSGAPVAALLAPWQAEAFAVPPSFQPMRVVADAHDGSVPRFAHPSRGPPGSKVPLYIRHRALLN